MAERDLTQGSLARHLRAMAIPAAMGMLATTLYNIVDTYYAGWISTEAQAGLSVSFAAYMMLMAVSVGLNMGAGALIGGALGAKDADGARAYAAGAIGAAGLLSIILFAFGQLQGDMLLRLMGVQGDVFETASSYMTVLFFGLPGFMIGFTANGILTAQGDTKTNRNAQIAAFLANIALNPILMYGAGLGFYGIALSTVLIQFAVATFVVSQALRTTAMQGVRRRQFVPSLALSMDLAKQSAPASLNMMVMMAGGFLIQTHLQPFGAAAVAGYGIAFRVEQLILLPILAISFASMPLVAQNFGAQDYARVRQAVTLAVTVAVGLALCGAVLLALGGVAMTRLFTADPAAIQSGAAYLALAALMMPAYSAMFIVTAFFQGVKRPIWSSVIGVYRQIFALALYPALFVAWTDWGLTAVWAGLFTAVWSGFLLAAVLTLLIGRAAIGGMRPDFDALRPAAT